MDQGNAVTEHNENQELSRYDISVAGKKFNIASRRGEPHVRDVEKLIAQITEGISKTGQSHGPNNLALLVALNLADHLVILQGQATEDSSEWDERMEFMVEQLENVLPTEEIG